MTKALVVATGMNSVYGRVKALVEKERSNTPLQDKLEELADFIGWLGVGAAVLTFLALIGKVLDSRDFSLEFSRSMMFNFFSVGLSPFYGY